MVVVRHIKLYQFNELVLSQIEYMTNTKVILGKDEIQIFGDTKNCRYARLLVRDFILFSLLNVDQSIPATSQNNAMNMDIIRIFKKAMCVWNSISIIPNFFIK
jgi:hypothetical protein